MSQRSLAEGITALNAKYEKNEKSVALKNIRAIIKANVAELGHIKTAGAGRSKKSVMQDLMEWVQVTQQQAKHDVASDDEGIEYEDFNVNPNGSYWINMLLHLDGYLLANWLKSKSNQHVKLVKAMCEEQKNGGYKDWDDVEERVHGVRRTMFQNYNKFEFQLDEFSRFASMDDGANQPLFNIDAAVLRFDKVSEKVLQKMEKCKKSKREYNMMDESADEECIASCYGKERKFIIMKNDPRKLQKIQQTNGNIVMVVAYDAANMYLGHGTGCLITDEAVLTCAHNFVNGNSVHKNAVIFAVRRFDGVFLAQVKQATIPGKWKGFNHTQNRNAEDVAVALLDRKVKTNAPFPVFSLSFAKYVGGAVRADGYPGRVGYDRQNGFSQEKAKMVYNSFGMQGIVTKCGVNMKSVQSTCFVTGGNSGGPLFLCDEEGNYVYDNAKLQQPILVAIVNSTGGRMTGDSSSAVPINAWTLAFIAQCIGLDALKQRLLNKSVEDAVKKYVRSNNSKQTEQMMVNNVFEQEQKYDEEEDGDVTMN